jgi:hypothetical protein
MVDAENQAWLDAIWSDSAAAKDLGYLDAQHRDARGAGQCWAIGGFSDPRCLMGGRSGY